MTYLLKKTITKTNVWLLVKHESTTVFEKWVSDFIFRIKYEKLESLTEGIMLIPSVEFRAAIVPMTGHSLSHFLNNNFLRNLLAFRTRVIRMSIKWNVRMSLMYTSIKYRKVVSCTQSARIFRIPRIFTQPKKFKIIQFYATNPVTLSLN